MKKPQWASDRNMQMFRDLLEGHTLRSVAEKYDISHERVRQVCQTIRTNACRGANQQERGALANLRAATASTEGMRINHEALLERVEAYLAGPADVAIAREKRKSQFEKQMGL